MLLHNTQTRMTSTQADRSSAPYCLTGTRESISCERQRSNDCRIKSQHVCNEYIAVHNYEPLANKRHVSQHVSMLAWRLIAVFSDLEKF